MYEGLNSKQLELMRSIEDNLQDEVIRLVKIERVDPNFTTNNIVNSPIYLAIHNNNYGIAKWLIEEGGVKVDKKTFEWAGICGNPSICKLLLNKI